MAAQTWEPLLHATDNPKACTCTPCARVGGDALHRRRAGPALKLDRAGGRFAALTLPYKGTLFGLAGKDRRVLAHGLRGNVVRSTDGGAAGRPFPPAAASA